MHCYHEYKKLYCNYLKNLGILSIFKGLPNLICVYEIWLNNLKPFVSKLYGYDYANKLSYSNLR